MASAFIINFVRKKVRSH